MLHSFATVAAILVIVADAVAAGRDSVLAAAESLGPKDFLSLNQSMTVVALHHGAAKG